jgi:hypothetical protein
LTIELYQGEGALHSYVLNTMGPTISVEVIGLILFKFAGSSDPHP